MNFRSPLYERGASPSMLTRHWWVREDSNLRSQPLQDSNVSGSAVTYPLEPDAETESAIYPLYKRGVPPKTPIGHLQRQWHPSYEGCRVCIRGHPSARSFKALPVIEEPHLFSHLPLLVVTGGVEPPLSKLSVSCFNQLSYATMFKNLLRTARTH